MNKSDDQSGALLTGVQAPDGSTAAFAARLNGRTYGNEITKAECAEAAAAGLVVLFGYSDDNVELRGAINAEIGAYDGTTLRITPYGPLSDWDSLDKESEEEVERYFLHKQSGWVPIEALWCDESGYSWTYRTQIPHATFDIMEEGEHFCRGIVFRLDEARSHARAAAPISHVSEQDDK